MRTNGHGKPVVALDIDGTLGDYHGHFLKFAEGWFGFSFPKPEELNPGLPLWQFMNVGLADYRQCKLAYRQGGLKRSMPCYSGSSWLTQRIQSEGAEVWICTTRPYLRLDNIDPDTREWLRRNNIRYDAVLFDRIEDKGSKYTELKEQAGDRVAAIVDDLPEMLLKASEAWSGRDLPTLVLRDQPYNQHADLWPRAANNIRITKAVSAAIEKWKMLNG